MAKVNQDLFLVSNAVILVISKTKVHLYNIVYVKVTPIQDH